MRFTNLCDLHDKNEPHSFQHGKEFSFACQNDTHVELIKLLGIWKSHALLLYLTAPSSICIATYVQVFFAEIMIRLKTWIFRKPWISQFSLRRFHIQLFRFHLYINMKTCILKNPRIQNIWLLEFRLYTNRKTLINLIFLKMYESARVL